MTDKRDWKIGHPRPQSATGWGRWYFTVESDTYGMEWYGPYDTWDKTEAGMRRVQDKARELDDGVPRSYYGPLEIEVTTRG